MKKFKVSLVVNKSSLSAVVTASSSVKALMLVARENWETGFSSIMSEPFLETGTETQH